MFTKKNKYHIYLTEEERRLAVKALIDKRNALIAAGRYTDAIDDILFESYRESRKGCFLSAFGDNKKFLFREV